MDSDREWRERTGGKWGVQMAGMNFQTHTGAKDNKIKALALYGQDLGHIVYGSFIPGTFSCTDWASSRMPAGTPG
uniref:DUF6783 domain-containing protein n=1 Tax=Enterocloster aldenensis TaxID=358742 RepID=UPI003513C3E8